MRARIFWFGVLAAFGCVQAAPAQAEVSIATLRSMPPEYLLAQFRAGRAAAIAEGPIRGHVLSRTGTALAGPLALGGRAVWQGKVIEEGGTAVNRFFGTRVIRGQLSQGPSWHDGQPAMILDYENTSTIYRNYRDEIRQVAPGLYLGLMFDRTASPPRLVRFFALESP
jgi:hypothetical protein